MEDKRIITAPDTDLSEHFQIMLMDFEWVDIAALSDSINKLPGKITLYLYGSNDTDHNWCISTVNQVSSVLIDMRHAGNIELLKGVLLPKKNVYVLGDHMLDKLYHNKVIDIHSWLAIEYKKYQNSEEQNGI